MDGTVKIELAKDSKEIAAASKRDSSAMKIVAVLTTVFLPGTFMAVSSTTQFSSYCAVTTSYSNVCLATLV
jgi:hypothetical protein